MRTGELGARRGRDTMHTRSYTGRRALGVTTRFHEADTAPAVCVYPLHSVGGVDVGLRALFDEGIWRWHAQTRSHLRRALPP